MKTRRRSSLSSAALLHGTFPATCISYLRLLTCIQTRYIEVSSMTQHKARSQYTKALGRLLFQRCGYSSFCSGPKFCDLSVSPDFGAFLNIDLVQSSKSSSGASSRPRSKVETRSNFGSHPEIILEVTFPAIRAIGRGPNMRESLDHFRLSPTTQQ